MTGLGLGIEQAGAAARLSGDLDLHTAPGPRGAGTALAAANPGVTPRLDLHALRFMDSSGLGAITAAHEQPAAAEGQSLLCRPTTQGRQPLSITGLAEILVVRTESAPAFRPSEGQ